LIKMWLKFWTKKTSSVHISSRL